MRKVIQVNLPVDIVQGKSGLVFITSPLIQGVLASGANEAEALGRVQAILDELMEAMDDVVNSLAASNPI